MFIEPSRADEADYSQIHKVLFGCLPADLMHPCDYEELHARLADLIEPEERTCHIKLADVTDSLGQKMYRCSECGALMSDDACFFDGVDEIGWFSFCPNCGARVIADE